MGVAVAVVVVEGPFEGSEVDAAASAADADMGVVGGECLQDVVDGTGGGHAAALGGHYHAVGKEIG